MLEAAASGASCGSAEVKANAAVATNRVPKQIATIVVLTLPPANTPAVLVPAEGGSISTVAIPDLTARDGWRLDDSSSESSVGLADLHCFK